MSIWSLAIRIEQSLATRSVRAAATVPTFDGKNGRRQCTSDHPYDHDDFELFVAKRRRVAAPARLYFVHLLESGGRHADFGHPAQPVVDQPALENPLDDQVGRFRVRRPLGEPETDVKLVHALPARPQVVQQRRRHVFRFHEVFLVQALGQDRVPPALQALDPVVHAAFGYEPLAELHVHRILREFHEKNVVFRCLLLGMYLIFI